MRRARIIIVTSGAIAIATLTTPALAQTVPGAGPWHMHDGWFGWGPLGALIWLLVLGLAIIGVVTAVRLLSGRRKDESSGALKVLDERYARGEIDREEYLLRRKDIGGD